MKILQELVQGRSLLESKYLNALNDGLLLTLKPTLLQLKKWHLLAAINEEEYTDSCLALNYVQAYPYDHSD